MNSRRLMLGFCGAWLAACGGGNGDDGNGGGGGGNGGGDLTFQDMCDQGATAMCEQASRCGMNQSTSDCIAQAKAFYCPGGVDQYCGVGMAFQSSKASACLDALHAISCTALATIPTPCTPEVLCAAQAGTNPATPGAACRALVPGQKDSETCDPKASLCYAAGTSSSCADSGLCVGDSTGMTCAAHCTVDDDCLAAGPGLLCLQECTVTILNGFCITPKAKSKFMQYRCNDTKYSSTSGTSGWSQ